MALTSSDETDLLMPLHTGVYEEQRFSTFLERLRRRTQAAYVGILFRQGDLPMHETTELFSGLDLRAEAIRLGTYELFVRDRSPYDLLRPGRVYSMAEFTDHNPVLKALRQNYARLVGIVDERIVRIALNDGISAWLLLARREECSARDSMLLSALAPHISVALNAFMMAERQRIRTEMATQTLARAGAGWVVFDREARVLEIDEAVANWLSTATGVTPHIGSRIGGLDGAASRMLIDTAAAFAIDRTSCPRAVPLATDPRIEALLEPTDASPAAARAMPVMLAMCRKPARGATNRAPRLAELSGLPKREAELAIALSDGKSIAEAAQSLGLTVETARNYSKRIYARLGLRGQAELVRHIYESSAILA